MIAVMWRAIGRAEIVHSGIGGWPIPIGWIGNPIAVLRGKKLLMVVESAFWRIPAGQEASTKDRLRAILTEWLGRFFVNRADLLIFTQPAYRDSLLTTGRGKSVIMPATWIGEDDILSTDEARNSWAAKPAADGLRLLFVGRLVPAKGVDVMLAALEQIDRRGTSIRVDVIGEGPRRDRCVAVSQKMKSVETAVLDPVPYGPEFFELLRGYHAIIVPSLSDEQPRLVFDAFSQSMPVLASRTNGLTPHVIEGETGRLFEVGDVDSLVNCLIEVAANPEDLQRLGMNGLDAARNLTHRAMHERRWQILVDHFGAD